MPAQSIASALFRVPLDVGDRDWVTPTSVGACRALLPHVGIAPGDVVASFSADICIPEVFLNSAYTVQALDDGSSPCIHLPAESSRPCYDWICCAIARKTMHFMWRAASCLCRKGFCLRSTTYILEPNKKHADFLLCPSLHRVLIMSDSILSDDSRRDRAKRRRTALYPEYPEACTVEAWFIYLNDNSVEPTLHFLRQ